MLPVPQCRPEGSCGGRCGGGSDLDCWCDDLCQQHGDCCCDRESLCSGPDNNQDQQDFLLSPADLSCSSAGSCAGRCEDGSDEDCWCDDHCHHLGDCCCDREQFCQVQGNITTSTSLADVTTSISTSLEDVTTSTILADITTMPTLRLITTDLVPDQETTTVVTTTGTERPSVWTESPAGTDCWCSTNTAGPVKEACCVFPFSYKSEVHHSCVEVEDGSGWCSTNTTQDGQFVPDQWGYCGPSCYFDTPTPQTTPRTTPQTTAGQLVLRLTTKDISVLSGITQSATRDGKEVTAGPVFMVSSATKTQAVGPSSTSTVTTPSTSTTTTPGPLKATPEFLQTLPPSQSVVFIHPELHDPVRVSWPRGYLD